MIELNKILEIYSSNVKSIHPMANLFPLPSEDEFNSLVDGIKNDGLMRDIIINSEGALIDGRSRLLACYEARVEPRFEVNDADPLVISINANLKRRNLTVGQKAAIGDKIRHIYDEAARARQAATQAGNVDRGAYGRVVTGPGKFPGTGSDARDEAGRAVGVDGSNLDRFRLVKTELPKVANEIEAGTRSLDSGYKEARAHRKSNVIPIEKKGNRTVFVVPLKGKAVEIAAPKESKFNRTNGNVEWASWTWNPVTGCNHGCKFCYAREIAHKETMSNFYPFKFEPAFHPYRLKAPAFTKKPESDDPRDGRVFVCSMADLFGKWVPEEWVSKVFEACMTAPDWEYLFLTKWPNRYSQQQLLENSWYGASVIQQSDVDRVTKAMNGFNGKNIIKWLSLEPLLGPLELGDLSWCDLIVIGSQTKTIQPFGDVEAVPAKFDWVVDIVFQARKYNVPYYIKPNAGMDKPGMELPKMDPRRK